MSSFNDLCDSTDVFLHSDDHELHWRTRNNRFDHFYAFCSDSIIRIDWSDQREASVHS